MLHEPKTIIVDPESELGHLLDEATDAPLILEKNGMRYRLVREGREDIWVDYDPEAVRRALAAFAESITPEEAERMKATIYQAREDGTRPANRP